MIWKIRNPYSITGLSVVLLLSLTLQAQSKLELHLAAHQLINGVPDTFSFVFVNVGDHEVRIPPLSPCIGTYSGTLILKFEFSPPQKTGVGGGCGGGLSEIPGILEQAKSWRRLQPGESLTKSYKRSELFVVEQAPGTYEFWAEYRPLQLTAEEMTLLEQAGIDFPRQVLRSSHLRFHRSKRRTPKRNDANETRLSCSPSANTRSAACSASLPATPGISRLGLQLSASSVAACKATALCSLTINSAW